MLTFCVAIFSYVSDSDACDIVMVCYDTNQCFSEYTINSTEQSSVFVLTKQFWLRPRGRGLAVVAVAILNPVFFFKAASISVKNEN